ncbi:efflux RND transporter permease subunit, partial [Clostridium perfringens]
LSASNGDRIPLSQVATIQPDSAPLVVNHQSGFPSTTISFNLAPGVSIGTAVSAVQKVQAQLHLPPTLQTSFAGNAQAFQSALAGQGILILLAL